MEFKKISEVEWEIPKTGKMNVPAKIFASEKLFEKIKEDKTIEQIKNVAMLPGILKSSIACPDAHQGYGFPIGGVAAFDLEKGIVSPGGVGYDINCGIRLLSTNITSKEFLKKAKIILHDIKRTIPSGVGRGHIKKLGDDDLDKILTHGARWAIERGCGTKNDLENCEENGEIKKVNIEDVSQRARARGKSQMGTLGAGNHFIEAQEVKDIFDSDTAKVFGLKKGTICIMIHCGSRGLGHQVASDYIKLMEKEIGIENLPDRELISAPINSELGKKYLSAMGGAANFAFCNRQIIMNSVRNILKRYFPKNKNNLVYDVAHNIAKFEEHIIDGQSKKVCIHRKGATRSFGPGRKELSKKYQKTGQPVIIPGSMGTSSYVLVGTEKAEKVSFASTAHGAGRAMSRSKAIKNLRSEDIKKDLESKGIIIEINSEKSLIAEAPQAYKDIEEVVSVSHKAGIGNLVAKLNPLAVAKG